MIYDVLIIGAGASGLFLASNLRELSVAILEKNGSAGKKIIASGGGRCNVTNRKISVANYHFTSLAGQNLVQSALSGLKFSDVLEFFGELKFKEQKNSQFFCASSSRDVLGVLLRKAQGGGAKIFYNCEVVSASKSGEIFEILTADGQKFSARNLVVASGGASYKALGASEISYEIAKSFGLNVVKIAPALVGFTVQKDEFWFKNLSGVSLKAEIWLTNKNLDALNLACAAPKNAQNLLKFRDDILFTHKGVSGPAALNASLFWSKGTMSLNFAPEFDPKNLTQGKKQLSSVLGLPRRFTLEFLAAKGLKDAPFSEYDASQKELVMSLFDYKFSPAGTFGFERAEVTKGGVAAECLDENFECKSVKNLFFIAEATEITGMLGGYNLHFAFASALIAARRIALA